MSNLVLKCQRCSHLWTYKGKNKFVTSCSNCKTSVYFKKNMIPSNSVVEPEGKTESKARVSISVGVLNYSNSLFCRSMD